MNMIGRIRNGATLVVVTHNIPSVRLAGGDLALRHEGRIVVQETADALDATDHLLVQAFMRSEGGG